MAVPKIGSIMIDDVVLRERRLIKIAGNGAWQMVLRQSLESCLDDRN